MLHAQLRHKREALEFAGRRLKYGKRAEGRRVVIEGGDLVEAFKEARVRSEEHTSELQSQR